MKKRIIIIVGILSLICITTGCTNKKTMKTEKFIKIVKRYDLKPLDIIGQYENSKIMKKATVAESEDYWQIEFYELINKKEAENLYETQKKKYTVNKKSSKVYDEKEKRNYEEFTIEDNQKYMHVCRIKNTILYVKVSPEYKDIVKPIIEEIGY